MTGNNILLEIRNLKKHFPIYKGIFRSVAGWIKAVDDISLQLGTGEVLGLVGESGCGKTTAGRSILRLLEPTGGEILYYGHGPAEPVNVTTAPPKVIKKLRQEMQIIYQDPQSSLNERMTVGSIVSEPLLVHKIGTASEREQAAEKLLKAVGLESGHMSRYPHQFSGGQRQRIAIARALCLKPKMIIADEAVSALDVAIQAQVLLLLKELQNEFNLAYIFITHDLAVVRYIADRMAVMYLGRIVESAATEELFYNPQHPYSEALISAVPVPDPDYRVKRILLQGDVPSPLAPPPGCHFHPRCRYAEGICRNQSPTYRELTPGHYVSCHLVGRLDLWSFSKSD